MKHCTTNLKVESLITDGVAGIVYLLNSSGCAMALGVNTASNGNEYQGYSLGREGVKADGS
jgi:hypothetical protein